MPTKTEVMLFSFDCVDCIFLHLYSQVSNVHLKHVQELGLKGLFNTVNAKIELDQHADDL